MKSRKSAVSNSGPRLNKLSEVMYLNVDVYKTALAEIEKRKNTNRNLAMMRMEQGKW